MPSGRFLLSFLPIRKFPNGGVVRLRLVQDAENYVEIENTDGYGPGTLTKVVAGQVVDSVDFTTEYSQEVTYDIEVSFRPDLVIVEAFDDLVAIDQDTTPLAYVGLEIETFQQNAYYDDLLWLDYVDRGPFVFVNSPLGGTFTTTGDLDARATGIDFQPGWGVRFVLDEGTPNEAVFDDYVRPYETSYAGLPLGTHSLGVYTITASGSVVPAVGLSDVVENLGVGERWVAFGDSITDGRGDDFDPDDVSADGRTAGGGWPPVLNDLLSAHYGYPNVIENEGRGGLTALSSLTKIGGALSRHTDASYYLLMFGTNDSASGTPSGLGLSPGDAGYADSYKSSLQVLIDRIVGDGIVPVIAKPPIAYGAGSLGAPYPDPPSEPRNLLILEYHQVIDELVAENGLPMQGPDFYAHFLAHPEQMDDNLHPDGEGYEAMADLWLQALTAPPAP